MTNLPMYLDKPEKDVIILADDAITHLLEFRLQKCERLYQGFAPANANDYIRVSPLQMCERM